MTNDTRIAVDLAKSVFEVAVSSQPGKIDERHRLSRKQVLAFFVQRPPATVIMEACGSAHYWGREIQRLGHYVVLVPPQQIRPYVVRNKTDRTDATGMLEAYRNAEIRPVPVKSVEQQTLAALHRGCARRGWPNAPPTSTPCVACCTSSVSSFPSAPITSCRASGP